MVSIKKGNLDKLIREELERYIQSLNENVLKNEEHLLIRTKKETEISIPQQEEEEEEENDLSPLDSESDYQPDPEVMRRIMKIIKSSKEGGN